jgi:hypothetical protein
MKRLTWRLRRRLTALLLAGVLACAAALAGLVAGPAMAAGGRHTVTVTSPGNQAGAVGTAASLQIQATDSAAGQALTYTATGLPAGLSISSSTGLITGTPTTAGTVTVTAKDRAGASGSAAFTWTITPPGGPAPQLQVSGNKLVNSATGQQVVLHGVDRSGGEYACVNGTGVWDGPMDQTAVSAIKSWNVNAVRVPLNEACWNGESYVNSAYAGANYISADGPLKRS